MKKPKRPSLAIISDLHLSERAPICRKTEDWFGDMGHYLGTVAAYCREHECPLAIAGDVFHRFNPSPKLVNFAVEILDGVQVLMIPGQHDLPNHQIERVGESGFYSLNLHSNFVDLSSKKWQGCGFQVGRGFEVFGAGWGQSLPRPTEAVAASRKPVGIVHRYMWDKEAKFHGAPDELHVSNSHFEEEFERYHLIVVGDNHQRWERWSKAPAQTILNPGSFMRRDIGQAPPNHSPAFFVLNEDGSVCQHDLEDIDEIKNPTDSEINATIDLASFLDLIKEGARDSESFIRTAREHLMSDEGIDKEVKDEVEDILQTVENE